MKRFLVVAALLIASPVLAQTAPPVEVTIKLPVEQWNVVLQALGSQPYERVQGLIAELQRQAGPQVAPPVPEKKVEPKK